MSKWQFVPTLNTENEDGARWIPRQVWKIPSLKLTAKAPAKMMVGRLSRFLFGNTPIFSGFLVVLGGVFFFKSHHLGAAKWGEWMDVRKRLWRTSHTLPSLHGVQWCLGQTGCRLVPDLADVMENARELVRTLEPKRKEQAMRSA